MKILSVENLSRSFGGIKANDNISFNVDEGSILGIIGPNGAGKSTLFDLITGYTKADTGKVEFFGKNIFGLSPDKISNLGVGRTFQKLKPFADQTLLENVMIGAFICFWCVGPIWQKTYIFFDNFKFEGIFSFDVEIARRRIKKDR